MDAYYSIFTVSIASQDVNSTGLLLQQEIKVHDDLEPPLRVLF